MGAGVDGERQDQTAVVVGVFADQIDPARGGEHPVRVPAEGCAEEVGGARVELIGSVPRWSELPGVGDHVAQSQLGGPAQAFCGAVGGGDQPGGVAGAAGADGLREPACR